MTKVKITPIANSPFSIKALSYNSLLISFTSIRVNYLFMFLYTTTESTFTPSFTVYSNVVFPWYTSMAFGLWYSSTLNQNKKIARKPKLTPTPTIPGSLCDNPYPIKTSTTNIMITMLATRYIAKMSIFPLSNPTIHHTLLSWFSPLKIVRK